MDVGSSAHPLGLRSAHWLASVAAPVSLYSRAFCGPRGRSGSQSSESTPQQEPTTHDKYPVPLPSPPRAWRGRVLFTALLIPQQDSSPSAHRGHLLHNHTPFPAFPSLALHFTLLLAFPGIVSQGGHLSSNPSQGLLLGKRKLRQSPCLCKWFSCSWLRCMCVCV